MVSMSEIYQMMNAWRLKKTNHIYIYYGPMSNEKKFMVFYMNDKKYKKFVKKNVLLREFDNVHDMDLFIQELRMNKIEYGVRIQEMGVK